MGSPNGAYDGRIARRDCRVRSACADRSGEAARAGAAVPVVSGGAVVDLEPAQDNWCARCVEGAVSRVEYYDFPRGAVYRHPVPVVGGDEEVEVEDYTAGWWEGEDHGVGEWVGGEYGRGDGGRDNYAVGCVEDEDDVGEGEDWGVCPGEADIKGQWAHGLLFWDWAKDYVD